jgi:hypothetical protein
MAPHSRSRGRTGVSRGNLSEAATSSAFATIHRLSNVVANYLFRLSEPSRRTMAVAAMSLFLDHLGAAAGKSALGGLD